MQVLCGYHAKNAETCKWVIENCSYPTDNTTVIKWVEACKEYLQSHNDGPAMVSTGQ
jgi:hypothetical protein